MSKRPYCACRGASGVKKLTYRSRRRAVTTALRRGWEPHVYRCPTGTGWHLTRGH